MNIRSLGKKIVRGYLDNKAANQRRLILKNKIDHLKSAGLFKEFPDDKVSPVIYKYSFFDKRDKDYLDFFYSVLLNPDPGFIPIPVYLYHVEPALNNSRLLSAFADKNFYDKFLKGSMSPKTRLRKINDDYYTGEYQKVNLTSGILKEITSDADSLILKPSIDSGAGKSIVLFKRNAGVLKSGNEEMSLKLLTGYPDFVLQDAVVQHEFFRQFNPDSNNTVRILTYKSVITNEAVVLHRLLRIGRKGHFLDHDNLGGIAAGIGEDGILNKYGINAGGIRLTVFNDVDFSEVRQVPFMQEIEKISLDLASQVFYGRLLALDFSVDYSGKPLLLEINCQGNGVSQYQMNNGALFGKYTEEILDYCTRRYGNINLSDLNI